MPRNLLLLRFIIFNACGAALLVWAWRLGYAQQVFEGGQAHLIVTGAIAVLFAAGLASTTWRVLAVNGQRNKFASLRVCMPGYEARQMFKRASRFEAEHAHLWDLIEWLVLLSLIGNAVGFFIASNGIDATTLSSTEGIVANAGKMLGGVGVAISATIIGGIASMWTWLNVRMLDTAASLHVEDLK